MRHLALTTRQKNFRPPQKGSAALEFALVISLLVLITGGIIEFGRVFWYYDALSKATRDGARYLSTLALPTDTTLPLVTSDAVTLVVNAAAHAGLPAFGTSNVQVSCDPNCVTPNEVTVSITGYAVDFGSWFPMPIPAGSWELKPHTTMRYMCDVRGQSC